MLGRLTKNTIKNIWIFLVCAVLCLWSIDTAMGAFTSRAIESITASIDLAASASEEFDGEDEIGPGGGTITIGPGATLNIPAGALGKTFRVYHYTQNPKELQYRFGGLDRKDILLAFHLYPEDLKFNKPVTLTLSYQGIYDLEGKNEDTLKVAWYDGYEWRVVGGKLNKEEKTISTKITHLGYYGLFSVRPSASLYRSKEKILTPAWKDGKNDKAVFDGLNDTSTTIKIYDVTGKKVRDIEDLPYEWDGKDDDGDIVESGVYIYQFKVNGEIISGTIAIAK